MGTAPSQPGRGGGEGSSPPPATPSVADAPSGKTGITMQVLKLSPIASVGTIALVLAACGAPSPATSTAIERANRSISATFGAARPATVTAIVATDAALSAAYRPVIPHSTTVRSTPGAPASAPTTLATPTMRSTPIVPTTASTAPSATAAYGRLMAAVAAVDTGELDTTLDYGAQARTVMSVRFDLGHGRDAARTHAIVTYQSAVAIRSTEAITVGGQTWQRMAGAPWAATDRADNARDKVRALLPRAATDGVGEGERGDAVVLRWYDSERASDVEVEIDATSGIPRQMRQISRADGSLLTVTYRAWNTPVAINAPDRA